VSLEPSEVKAAAKLAFTTLKQVFEVQPDEVLLVKMT